MVLSLTTPSSLARATVELALGPQKSGVLVSFVPSLAVAVAFPPAAVIVVVAALVSLV